MNCLCYSVWLRLERGSSDKIQGQSSKVNPGHDGHGEFGALTGPTAQGGGEFKLGNGEKIGGRQNKGLKIFIKPREN